MSNKPLEFSPEITDITWELAYKPDYRHMNIGVRVGHTAIQSMYTNTQ